MAAACASIEAEAQEKARQAPQDKTRKAGKNGDDVTGAVRLPSKRRLISRRRNGTSPTLKRES